MKKTLKAIYHSDSNTFSIDSYNENWERIQNETKNLIINISENELNDELKKYDWESYIIEFIESIRNISENNELEIDLWEDFIRYDIIQDEEHREMFEKFKKDFDQLTFTNQWFDWIEKFKIYEFIKENDIVNYFMNHDKLKNCYYFFEKIMNEEEIKIYEKEILFYDLIVKEHRTYIKKLNWEKIEWIDYINDSYWWININEISNYIIWEVNDLFFIKNERNNNFLENSHNKFLRVINWINASINNSLFKRKWADKDTWDIMISTLLLLNILKIEWSKIDNIISSILDEEIELVESKIELNHWKYFIRKWTIFNKSSWSHHRLTWIVLYCNFVERNKNLFFHKLWTLKRIRVIESDFDFNWTDNEKIYRNSNRNSELIWKYWVDWYKMMNWKNSTIDKIKKFFSIWK